MVIPSKWQLFNKIQSVFKCFISVAGQGIKALDTHAKGTKHIQRLPNSHCDCSTGKIPFTLLSNTVIASEPENAAKKVKQTLIVPHMENNQQSTTWGYMDPWCSSMKIWFLIHWQKSQAFHCVSQICR